MFEQNLAESTLCDAAGGAIALDVLSTATVSGSRFVANRAVADDCGPFEPGGSALGGAVWSGTAERISIVDSVFAENEARGGAALSDDEESGLGAGGALYVTAPADLERSIVVGNVAVGGPGGRFGGDAMGGGAFWDGALETVWITRNRALGGEPGGEPQTFGGRAMGGGLYGRLDAGRQVTLDQNLAVSGEDGPGGVGGGANLLLASTAFRNWTVTQNVSNGTCGSLCVNGGNMVNSTIAYNVSRSPFRNGIYSSFRPLRLANTIVAHNIVLLEEPTATRLLCSRRSERPDGSRAQPAASGRLRSV